MFHFKGSLCHSVKRLQRQEYESRLVISLWQMKGRVGGGKGWVGTLNNFDVI